MFTMFKGGGKKSFANLGMEIQEGGRGGGGGGIYVMTIKSEKKVCMSAVLLTLQR